MGEYKFHVWAPDHTEECDGQVFTVHTSGEEGVEDAGSLYADYVDEHDNGSGVDSRLVFIRDLQTREVFARELSVEIIHRIHCGTMDRRNTEYAEKRLKKLKDDVPDGDRQVVKK